MHVLALTKPVQLLKVHFITAVFQYKPVFNHFAAVFPYIVIERIVYRALHYNALAFLGECPYRNAERGNNAVCNGMPFALHFIAMMADIIVLHRVEVFVVNMRIAVYAVLRGLHGSALYLRRYLKFHVRYRKRRKPRFLHARGRGVPFD